jgi:acyl-CoA thioesterase
MLPLAPSDGDDWPYAPELAPERAIALLECAQRFPVFRFLGMRLDSIEADRAIVSLEHRVELTQPMGALHGGFIATLIDTAVGWAMASTLKQGFTVLTVGLDVKFFKPVMAGRVTAEARIRRKGRQILHGEVTVSGPRGEAVAAGWCIYAPGRLPGGAAA